MNQQPLQLCLCVSWNNYKCSCTLILACKTEGEKGICFLQTQPRSHYVPCQVQSLKLQGWIFTSHCCKAWALVITSIYFNVIWVGYSLSHWIKGGVTRAALSRPPTVWTTNTTVLDTDNSKVEEEDCNCGANNWSRFTNGKLRFLFFTRRLLKHKKTWSKQKIERLVLDR